MSQNQNWSPAALSGFMLHNLEDKINKSDHRDEVQSGSSQSLLSVSLIFFFFFFVLHNQSDSMNSRHWFGFISFGSVASVFLFRCPLRFLMKGRQKSRRHNTYRRINVSRHSSSSSNNNNNV